MQIVTNETLKQAALNRRIAMLENMQPPRGAAANPWLIERSAQLQALQSGEIPYIRFPEGFRFQDHMSETTVPGMIGELSAGGFNDNFYRRRQYEIDAGRMEVQPLFEIVYNPFVDASLPKNVDIYKIKNVGVVLTEVKEGGEVNFVTVGEANHTIPIIKHARGLRYYEDLFLYNQVWNIGRIEREFGKATTALHNHIHFNPIITASLTGNNATTAVTVGGSIQEAYSRTIAKAINDSASDKTNPRPGPYVILCSSADVDMIAGAIRFASVPQQGFDVRPMSIAGNSITIVVYDGWSGTDGKKSVAYAGVPAGTCFVISLAHRDFDFQSYIKFPLREKRQGGDITRYIQEEVVYDTHLGVYTNPVGSVQSVALPTSFTSA